MMSYKPEFLVGGQWYGNAQRFATEKEAADSAAARFAVWTMAQDHRAVPSDDEVTYARVDGCDRCLTPEEIHAAKLARVTYLELVA